MPHIPVLPPAQASKESNAVYDEFYRRMSFPAPPNFITTQGHSHTAARRTCELVRNVLLNGEIPRRKKEMIFVAISRDRQVTTAKRCISPPRWSRIKCLRRCRRDGAHFPSTREN
jgi:hypothetical protein